MQCFILSIVAALAMIGAVVYFATRKEKPPEPPPPAPTPPPAETTPVPFQEC